MEFQRNPTRVKAWMYLAVIWGNFTTIRFADVATAENSHVVQTKTNNKPISLGPIRKTTINLLYIYPSLLVKHLINCFVNIMLNT